MATKFEFALVCCHPLDIRMEKNKCEIKRINVTNPFVSPFFVILKQNGVPKIRGLRGDVKFTHIDIIADFTLIKWYLSYFT